MKTIKVAAAILGAGLLLSVLPALAQGTISLNISEGASTDRNYEAGGILSPAIPPCRPELSRCVEGTPWLSIFAARRGQPYQVIAVESYMVADQVPLLYAGSSVSPPIVPSSTTRVFWGNDVLNDYCYWGDDANAMANTMDALTAGVFMMGSANRVTGRALAPLWPQTPVNSVGAYNTGAGAATPPFTTTEPSTYIAVITERQNANFGTFMVNVDGIDYGPFSNNGVGAHSVETRLGLECEYTNPTTGKTSPIPCWQPGIALVTGLANTTHTFFIHGTSAAGQTVYVDYVAWGSSGAPMILLAPPRHAVGGYALNCTHPSTPPTDATQAAWSAAKQAVASTASAAGLNAVFLDAQAAVLDVNSIESATAPWPNLGVPKCFLQDKEHWSGLCNGAYGVYIEKNVASP